MPRPVGIVASAQLTETQLRLPGSSSVTQSYAGAPDQASFQVTDYTADWFGILGDFSNDRALINHWDTASPNRSWSVRFIIGANGPTIQLYHSANGSTSAGTPNTVAVAAMSIGIGQYFGVRATRRTSDGAVKLYYSLVDPPVWQLLYSGIVGVAAQAPFNCPSSLNVGALGAAGGVSNGMNGYFRHGEVRNGFDGAGAVFASPDVRAVPEGAASFTDAQANVWTVGTDASLVTRGRP